MQGGKCRCRKVCLFLVIGLSSLHIPKEYTKMHKYVINYTLYYRQLKASNLKFSFYSFELFKKLTCSFPNENHFSNVRLLMISLVVFLY